MSFLIAIVVLSILQLAFTTGKFIAAKRLNIPVEKFVIGIDWGKPFFSKKIGETEFQIYPIFWGGFLEGVGEADKGKSAYLAFSSWLMMLFATAIICAVAYQFIPPETLNIIINGGDKKPFDPKAFWHNTLSIFIMLFLISILVLVHEAGHFLAARMFKIKVEKFGFGLPFGPILWQKQCGDTLLVVHAFLLGGYVSFPDDEKDCGLEKDSPERFTNKPIYQRLVVVSAGVLANIAAAIVIVFLTALLWGKLPTDNYETYIKEFADKTNVSLMQSGLQVGDKIVEINGSAITSQYGFQLYAIKSKLADGRISQITANKNLEALKQLNPKLSDTIPDGTVVKLPTPAKEDAIHLTDDMLRGFEKITDDKFELTESQKTLRDKIASAKTYTSDGSATLTDIAYALSDNACPLNMKIERNGKIIELPTIYSNKKGQVGVKLDLKRQFVATKTLKSAFEEGCSYLYTQTSMLLKGLWQLVSGKVPLDNMHGVVAVVKYGGDVIQQDGFFQGLLLTALISLDLAIVNFLPIPALDGGHVMFLLIEKIYGRKLDEETINTIATIGFMFLILLMVVVLYNDIAALVLHKI